MWFGSIIEDADNKLVVSGAIAQDYTTEPSLERVIFGRLKENGCLSLQCDSMDLTSLTQSFAPLGAKWHSQPYSQYCDTQHIIVITVAADTLLLEKQSRILEIDNSQLDTSYELIVWEDDNRVFFYEDDEFKLMYDFTLGFMDTLEFYLPKNRTLYSFHCDVFGEIPIQYPQKTVVTSIEWINLDGELYKKMATRPIVEGDETAIDLGMIIERTGSLNGLAGFTTLECVAEGCDGHVRCYEDSEIFYMPSDVECDYRTTRITTEEKSSIVVYPNPTRSTVHISGLNETIDEVQVIDCFGHVIHSTTASVVDMAYLPFGIYFIKVITSVTTPFLYKLVKL